jgi:prophage regulatory protein
VNHTTFKILKKPEIKLVNGLSSTGQFEQQRDGLLTPYINLSKRSVGLPEHEVVAIVAARAIGKSDDEIRLLVKALIKQRKTSANALLKMLAA